MEKDNTHKIQMLMQEMERNCKKLSEKQIELLEEIERCLIGNTTIIMALLTVNMNLGCADRLSEPMTEMAIPRIMSP